MSENPLPILFLSLVLYISTATLTIIFENLKSHRLNELLQNLGRYFFYQNIHQFFFKQETGHLIQLLKTNSLLLQITTLLSFFLWTQSTPHETLFSIFHSFAERFISSGAQDSYVLLAFFTLKMLSYGLIILLFIISPYVLAKNNHLFLQKLLSFPASISGCILIPITSLLTKITYRPEDKQQETKNQASQEVKESLLALIHDAESKWPLDDQNKKLLDGFFKLQDRVAREIMVPRVEIFALEKATSIQEATSSLLDKGFTRIPVYTDSIDKVVGILFAKDLLRIYSHTCKNSPIDLQFQESSIEPYIKPAMFIPSSKAVSSLLQDFRKKRTHIAVIVDEYGGTEGLVTIEDILEELVGDITDEYDQDNSQVQKIADYNYLVDAHMSILDLNEQLNLHIPQHPDYDSVSGFIFHKLGSIPLPGQIIHHDDFDLEVIECNERAVEKVQIQVSSHDEEPYKENTEE